MRISHEAIYQALYVQGRGALRRELTACLRTGRALRVPRARTQARGKKFVTDKVLISQRPAEAEDRAVPGHWEVDLIIGLDSSAVGTLVERTTRYCLLLHLPGRHDPAAVAAAMTETMSTLPAHLRRSLTWDQGKEMAAHKKLTGGALGENFKVYFCDPHSPWQRGSNENTNGLIRQYLPKGTDLSPHTQADLDHIAAELNGRPRRVLGWRTPAEVFDELLVASAT